MARGKSIAQYLKSNHWMFERENRRRRVAALRDAYGDNCWRCGHAMSFHPLASRRRATIEHLQAKTHGGTSEWANIRLCHKGCNTHLGTHPPEQKLRMRLALARQVVAEFRESAKVDPGSSPG